MSVAFAKEAVDQYCSCEHCALPASATLINSGREDENQTEVLDDVLTEVLDARFGFRATGRRDGEVELLNSLVEQESPESKLQTSVILGGCVTIGAIVVASLLGQDPWGGLSVTPATLSAAGLGLAAALPMAALRLWSWTSAAAQVIPPLQVMLGSKWIGNFELFGVAEC